MDFENVSFLILTNCFTKEIFPEMILEIRNFTRMSQFQFKQLVQKCYLYHHVFDIKKCKVCIWFYSSKNGTKHANMFNEFLKSFFVDLNEPVPAVTVVQYTIDILKL